MDAATGKSRHECQGRDTGGSPVRISIRRCHWSIMPSGPLYLIVKDDCVVLRSPSYVAGGSGARGPLDSVMVLRPPERLADPILTHVTTYQDALKSQVVLGNELETEVEGLLGVISLLGGPYIVVGHGHLQLGNSGIARAGRFTLIRGYCLRTIRQTADASEVVGMAPNYVQIRRVTKLGIRPVSTKGRQQAVGRYGWKHCDERRYLQMLRSAVVRRYVYFCHKYPLHRRLQDNASVNPALSFESGSPAFWGNGNDGNEFLWNDFLLRGIQDEAARASWGTACISGFGASRSVDFGGEMIVLTLISRRSNRRQGTRFYRRGADETGAVANFVETEMVLTRPDGARVSHVQVRGSVPLLWSQRPDLSWQPHVHFAEDEQLQTSVCQLHSEKLATKYGAMVVVNLVDSYGITRHAKNEAELGRRYVETLKCLRGYRPLGEQLPPPESGARAAVSAPIYVTWFDYHKECSPLRWERLRLLLDQVDALVMALGCTVLDKAGNTAFVQKGIVRTNCIDNLDRTNVVQSMFARRMLLAALGQEQMPPPDRADGATPSGITSGNESFEVAFKDLWTANANALSELYAGTPALKTDVVRTGKVTLKGALRDGLSSVTRYYINSFWDGRRQDSVDLWLGKYKPDRDHLSPFPSYRLPFVPGGAVFSASYAIQNMAPFKLTLRVGSWLTETALGLIEALFDLPDDSPVLIGLFAYAMLLLAFVGLWECILTKGPCATLRALRHGSHYVDKPLLVQKS